MKTNYKKILIALVIIFAGAGVLVFNLLYYEAKTDAITRLNQEQMIHARQAARGIEDFFSTWTRNLSALAKTDEIVANDAIGQHYLKLFFEANQSQILSITRVDEMGVIAYNFPQANSVARDISRQKHIRELLRDHRPVISDVFRAIEGFDTVAVYVPVFRGSEFKGGIAVLVNFKTIANRYLDVIKVGKTGYAWVISRDGTILYTPVAGFIGKSEFDVTKDSPLLKGMVDQMLQGHEGVAQYTFDRIGDQMVGPTRKYAVYLPVQIGNTFWSIAVASSEQDVFTSLNTFRNRLFVVIGALFICGMMFSALAARAWLIVKEEAKLRESERRLSLATDAANLGIWIRDLVRNEIWATDKWRTLFGFEKTERIDLNAYLQKLHPEDRDAVSRTLAKAVESDGHYETEYRVVRPDGQLRWIASRGRVEFNGANQPVLVRGTSLDITERRLAELEVAQQRNEVAHLARVTTLGEISGSLAHELNQPLGAILANAEAAELHLQSESPNLAELRNILADIRRDDLRAGEIIHGMRTFLRRRELEFQPLELGRLAREAVQLLNADAAARGVTIGFEIPPALPRVRGDRVHLQQVLVNLLVNSMDAMSPCPAPLRRILIRATQSDPDTVQISIRDSGTGIPPANVSKVFDPFHTTKSGGLGLGLSICRSIIEAHGGAISIENNIDRGATARFTLPVCPEEPHR